MLVDGTPLQEYQIQALITAIDQVRGEIAAERKAQADDINAINWRAESDQRLIQAAADVLFESQMERFIQLVKAESDASG